MKKEISKQLTNLLPTIKSRVKRLCFKELQGSNLIHFILLPKLLPTYYRKKSIFYKIV